MANEYTITVKKTERLNPLTNQFEPAIMRDRTDSSGSTIKSIEINGKETVTTVGCGSEFTGKHIDKDALLKAAKAEEAKSGIHSHQSSARDLGALNSPIFTACASNKGGNSR